VTKMSFSHSNLVTLLELLLRDEVSGKLSPFMVPLGQVRLFRE